MSAPQPRAVRHALSIGQVGSQPAVAPARSPVLCIPAGVKRSNSDRKVTCWQHPEQLPQLGAPCRPALPHRAQPSPPLIITLLQSPLQVQQGWQLLWKLGALCLLLSGTWQPSRWAAQDLPTLAQQQGRGGVGHAVWLLHGHLPHACVQHKPWKRLHWGASPLLLKAGQTPGETSAHPYTRLNHSCWSQMPSGWTIQSCCSQALPTPSLMGL